MRILVTGGAGFIGSHLCIKLVQQGHEVLCIDNFSTGNPKNVLTLKNSQHFQIVEHDITNPLPGDLGQFDQIYHLACPASPADYREIPLQILWINAAGTKNILHLAAKQDIPIVFTSTSEIYGDPHEHPQKETYWGNVNPLGERSCYSEGKRFAESMAINYWKHFRFPLKIARIFSTYGSHMRKHDGRVIPEFITKALLDEPLRIFGKGSQTRTFCYIDDMIEGLISLMATPKDFIGPINLGNPAEISIYELAKKIIQITGSSSLISFFPVREDDPLKRQPDIGRAQKYLNFNPKINLEDGLKRTIAFFTSV